MLFFFSSRRRHTRFDCDWSSDVCSSDLAFMATSKMPVTAPIIRNSGKEASQCVNEGISKTKRQYNTAAASVIRRLRSEERRVGKECRSGWWADHYIEEGANMKNRKHQET